MRGQVSGTLLLAALLISGLCAIGIVTQAQSDATLDGAFEASREHRAIQYTARSTTDPIQRLNRRIANNAVQMPFDRHSGYLKAVLAALDIPVSSQMVAFSKGSLQSTIISPSNP